MRNSIRHEFVEHIPDQIEGGVIYVSIRFATAVHSCACGCGEEVVTPFGPAEWSLTYDGMSVSLSPSIGNWSFACRSHYWVDEGRIRWARDFSEYEVASVRRKAKQRRELHYGSDQIERVAEDNASGGAPERPWWRLWENLLDWWRSR